VWGIAGIGKSFVVRSVYDHMMLGVDQHFKYGEKGYKFVCSRPAFTNYCWVTVPDPFNLKEFSLRLVRGFLQDVDVQAQCTSAISIIEGQDPIRECHRFMREHRCLVVIEDLRSKYDWDLIKAAFEPNSTRASIVVITNEAIVAMYCVRKKHQVVNVKGLEADMALNLFQKVCVLSTIGFAT
jgi:hypothetical protein